MWRWWHLEDLLLRLVLVVKPSGASLLLLEMDMCGFRAVIQSCSERHALLGKCANRFSGSVVRDYIGHGKAADIEVV